ncbi:hypothetical protein [Sphingomonas crocodyli]|uniref:Uncharacterized protein n=1 Tax=Sphingomonas crocodyli TaxID=1979270 RepID=A0A437LYC2_9SPHN|nr:hypothetical protein [Sphingomonas crocodyli]RVT90428.1 hypothetical protein EOD43_19415 [Sphingomonas crocodyli]
MSATLTAQFDTRREAEMTVERLVQQFDIERTAIFISGEDANTVGTRRAGADAQAADPSPPARGDASVAGPITLSVDLQDEAQANQVREAFNEFAAGNVRAS